LAVSSLLGSMYRSYAAGAARGWSTTAAKGGITIGNFNALSELNTSDNKAVVSLPDLKALELQLKEFGPDALNRFKRDARRVGTPARDALRSVYRSVGIFGPLGRPRRPGRKFDKMATEYGHARLSYERAFVTINTSRGIDVNYKNRNEGRALRQLKQAEDGTISIVRLLVKAPALIVADMAGKSNRKRLNSGFVRQYETKLFGGPKVVATERMRAVTPARVQARTTWLQALDRQAHNRRQNKASRYAWPTMEKYMSKHKINAAALINQVIAETNKKMAD